MPTRHTFHWLTSLNMLKDSQQLPANHIARDLPAGSWTLKRTLSLCLHSRLASIVLLDQPPSWVIALLIALRWLSPCHSYSLVILDMVFVRPASTQWGALLKCAKRQFFSRVDLFISYMKHLPALETLYGILPHNHTFVHFKANAFARRYFDTKCPVGEYVFTGGRSRRDFSTFCRALASLPYPATIATPEEGNRVFHGTTFDEAQIPNNITVVHDDGSPESWVGLLSNAKIVVLPIGVDSISPSGVGVYLQAMALGKSVIVSECPATAGIIESGNQAIVVPQGDVDALADAIRLAWEDDTFREGVATRGRHYAISLGGERELIDRIVEAVNTRFCF